MYLADVTEQMRLYAVAHLTFHCPDLPATELITTVKLSLEDLADFHSDPATLHRWESQVVDGDLKLRIAFKGHESVVFPIAQRLGAEYPECMGEQFELYSVQVPDDVPTDEWPEDAQVELLAASGYPPFYLSTTLSPFVPHSLFASTALRCAQELVKDAGLDPEEYVAGVGDESVMNELASVSVWAKEESHAIFERENLEGQVLRRLTALTSNPDLSAWLERTIGDHGAAQ